MFEVNKTVRGLKQSGAVFFNAIDAHLRARAFKPALAVPLTFFVAVDQAVVQAVQRSRCTCMWLVLPMCEPFCKSPATLANQPDKKASLILGDFSAATQGTRVSEIKIGKK